MRIQNLRTLRLAMAFSGAVLAPSLFGQAAGPANEEDIVELTPFVINDSRDRGWGATNALSASRTNLEIAKIPLGISVLTREFLDDLAVDDVTEAVSRYTPGVTVGRFNQLVIRGLENENIKFRNGSRFYSGNLRYSTGIERVEVLRGPAGILYGQTGPGGVVNYITKKPTFKNGITVRGVLGRWNRYRGEIDANLALNQMVGARINYAYEDADSFQDRVDSNLKSFDGVVTFRPWKPLTVSLNYAQDKSSRFPGTGVPLANTVTGFIGDPALDLSANRVRPTRILNEIPRNWNFFGNKSKIDETYDLASIDVTYQPTSELTLRSVYTETYLKSYSTFNGPSDGYRINRSDGALVIGAPATISGRQRRENPTWSNTVLWQPEFAGMKHRILAGYDTDKDFNKQINYFKTVGQNIPPTGFAWTGNGGLVSSPGSSNIFVDYPRLPWDVNTLDYNDIDSFIASGNAWISPVNFIETQTDAWYITDSISLLDEKLNLLLGIRRAEFDIVSYNILNNQPNVTAGKTTLQSKATSPQVGVAYEVVKGLTPYVSYSESNLAQNQANPDGQVFEPRTGEGWEVGVKFALLDGGLQGTLAYFENEYNNFLIADPRDLPGPGEFDGFRIPITGRTSKGYELEALWQSADLKWQIYGGANIYDGDVKDKSFRDGVEAQFAQFSIPEAQRAQLRENLYKPEYFVEEKYSSYVKYNFREGFLKNLSARVGYTYTGTRYNVRLFNLNQPTLSGYGLWDAGLTYGFKVGSGSWLSFDAAVTNLNDKNYVNTFNGAGYVAYGTPRDFRLSTTFRF